jgi:hypothetical protein
MPMTASIWLPLREAVRGSSRASSRYAAPPRHTRSGYSARRSPPAAPVLEVRRAPSSPTTRMTRYVARSSRRRCAASATRAGNAQLCSHLALTRAGQRVGESPRLCGLCLSDSWPVALVCDLQHGEAPMATIQRPNPPGPLVLDSWPAGGLRTNGGRRRARVAITLRRLRSATGS